MTKKELEIRCKVLEERMKRINEICENYKNERDAARTIGAIMANCDLEFIEQRINWKIQ